MVLAALRHTLARGGNGWGTLGHGGQWLGHGRQWLVHNGAQGTCRGSHARNRQQEFEYCIPVHRVLYCEGTRSPQWGRESAAVHSWTVRANCANGFLLAVVLR